MGSSGLGSTASSLGAGLGGGGGRIGGANDFMQVLQELAKPGSIVKKGDVVAEFDRQNMLNRLDDFRATIAQAEASFRNLQAEQEVTRKSHEHSIEVAKGAVEKARLDMKTAPVRSQIDTERLKLALEEAEARYKQLLAEVKFVRISEQSQLRVAELELQQARNELRRYESNAERMVVRAPMDGMLVMQNIIRGGELSPIQQGDQLYPGQMFAQIVDPSSMVVNASINQVDVELIRVGQKARVRFDAYPGLELPAHVTAVGAITKPGGQRAAYYKEVPIFLKLDQMDPRVIPDLSVSADIILDTAPEATIAPLASIFRDGPKSEPYAWVRVGNTFEKRPVELGLENNISVAVTKGLRAGDVVALEPPRFGPKQQIAGVQRQ